MFQKYSEVFSHLRLTNRWVIHSVAATLLILCSLVAVHAQTFTSGSTGADGALAPTQNTEIQLPESGVLNYTTVNIPANVTVTFKRNTKNTPVTILVQGDVNIAGRIDVSGKNGSYDSSGTIGSTGGLGGPGGFNGGSGGSYFDPYFNGRQGDGPGGGGGGRGSADPNSLLGAGGGGGFAEAGGNANFSNGGAGGKGGSQYGSRLLVQLIGGSGGGGGGGYTGTPGASGGGGGGAILLASSGTITFGPGQGSIIVDGGRAGGSGGTAGGGGAGGAIRVVATTLSGSADLSVLGQGGADRNANAALGARGYVRIEAFNIVNFTPLVRPGSSGSIGLPPATPPAIPQLVIASVAGQNAPAFPRGSFAAAPDITIAASQTNPVNVGIQGANIPVGTTVKVTITSETGVRTPAPDVTLAGTAASSNTTAQVTLPTGLSVISAIATIDLTIAKAEPIFIQGERVDKVEIAASFGGASEVTYITRSGKRIRQTE